MLRQNMLCIEIAFSVIQNKYLLLIIYFKLSKSTEEHSCHHLIIIIM